MTNLELSRIGNSASKWAGVSQMPLPLIRRGGRGGPAWSLPIADKMTVQPQDGAAHSMRQLVSITSHLHSSVLNEPEDAKLTGGTRTLNRRLSGLNVLTAKRKKPIAAAVLQHMQIA